MTETQRNQYAIEHPFKAIISGETAASRFRSLQDALDHVKQIRGRCMISFCSPEKRHQTLFYRA